MSFSESFSKFISSGVLYKLFDNYDNTYILIATLTSALCAYLLGSLNFAIMISKRAYHQDIRAHGSGNAGMTNMMRTYGKRAAILTFVGDAAKAIIAGLIGYAAFGQPGAHIAGLFCVIGHMYPIFFKFKGGKGVVTTAASMLVCNPYVFLIELILYVVIVAIWKYISLASIMCAMLYPVLLNGFDTVLLVNADGSHYNGSPYGIFTVAIALLVVFKHRENIKRLLNKTESKFKFKKSVSKEDVEEEI